MQTARNNFVQSKQKFARLVPPKRRIFVTNDGNFSVASARGEFLEVPYIFCRHVRKGTRKGHVYP